MKVIVIIIGAIITFTLSHHENVKTHHHAKLALRNSNPPGLDLFLNGTSGLIAFLNTTNHVAAIFDLTTNSLVVLNGMGGNAIAIYGHTILKISTLWSQSNSNFELYFRSLSGLQEIIKSGQHMTKAEVDSELSRLATQLGVESKGLENLIGASTTLHQMEKVLRILIKDEHFKAKGTLLRTITVFKGIRDFFAVNPQDLKKIDLSSIINAQNGLQALIRILQSLGPMNMSPLMNNLETLLHIIVELGGNDSDNGIDNLLRIIYNIFRFIDGHGCLDCLIQALIEVGENGGLEINGSDITPIIDDLLKLENSQSGGIFNVFIQFLRDLNNNNLFLNGINISEFLQTLRKDDYKGALEMIVQFFMRFNDILNPAKTIPRFFGYFLMLLNSGQGIRLLPQFLPGVQPEQLQQIQRVNITNIFQNRGDYPVFGQIYNLFQGYVGNASNGKMDFTSLLNQGSGGNLQEIFMNLFQNLWGIPINVFLSNCDTSQSESTTVKITTLIDLVEIGTTERNPERRNHRNHHGKSRLRHRHNKHLKQRKHEKNHKEKRHH